MKTFQRKLEQHLKDGGASLVGFADLRDLPADARRSFPAGISIAVALNPAIVAKITWGPTKEYFHEYTRVNTLLDQLGQHALDLLNKEGFRGLALGTSIAALFNATALLYFLHRRLHGLNGGRLAGSFLRIAVAAAAMGLAAAGTSTLLASMVPGKMLVIQALRLVASIGVALLTLAAAAWLLRIREFSEGMSLVLRRFRR